MSVMDSQPMGWAAVRYDIQGLANSSQDDVVEGFYRETLESMDALDLNASLCDQDRGLALYSITMGILSMPMVSKTSTHAAQVVLRIVDAHLGAGETLS